MAVAVQLPCARGPPLAMAVGKLLLVLALAPVARAGELCNYRPTLGPPAVAPDCVSDNGCNPDCGCLMRMGTAADDDPNHPVEAFGTPGIRPVSLPECVPSASRVPLWPDLRARTVQEQPEVAEQKTLTQTRPLVCVDCAAWS